MKNGLNILLAVVLALVLVCTLIPAQVYAQTDTQQLDKILKSYASKRDLTDWESIVLGINGVKIKTPLFAEPYFKRVEKEIAHKKGVYRLATDYARIALAYVSHGKDPAAIAGYNFTEKLIHFENRQNQGVNAYVWSLIALYGQDASVTNPLIENILAYERLSGGFSVSKPSAEKPDPSADVDITAMAITALSPYQSDKKVKGAVEGALSYLSSAQEPDGGYKANNTANAESIGQIIIALCSAGVDLNDTRFVKNGHSLTDALARFALKDGTYAHALSDPLTSDPIATRQAALALSAIRKANVYDTLTEAARASSGMKRGIFEW